MDCIKEEPYEGALKPIPCGVPGCGFKSFKYLDSQGFVEELSDDVCFLQGQLE